MMGNTERLSRQERERERAEFAFQIYKFMGVDRSLMRLLDNFGLMAVRMSMRTLERWSVKYDWQRRLLEENAGEKRRQEQSISRQVEAMNQRHAQFAQGLFGAALAGLNRLQNTMTDTERGKTLDLSVNEIVSLFRAAQSGERLARGQATNRMEVWVDVTSTVVNEFAMIFLSINEIPDSDTRKAEFIRLSDDMIRRYFTEQSKQALELKSGSYKVD